MPVVGFGVGMGIVSASASASASISGICIGIGGFHITLLVFYMVYAGFGAEERREPIYKWTYLMEERRSSIHVCI